MRFALLLAAPFLIAAAGDMSVATFLQKADALKAKGALALMSSDLGLLKREAQAAGTAWGRGIRPALARGDKSYGCPAKGTKLSYGQNELLADLRAVPAAQRARTSVKQAVFAGMRRRYPCR